MLWVGRTKKSREIQEEHKRPAQIRGQMQLNLFSSPCGAVWLSVCGGVPVSEGVLYQQLGCGSSLGGLFAQTPTWGDWD